MAWEIRAYTFVCSLSAGLGKVVFEKLYFDGEGGNIFLMISTYTQFREIVLLSVFWGCCGS